MDPKAAQCELSDANGEERKVSDHGAHAGLPKKSMDEKSWRGEGEESQAQLVQQRESQDGRSDMEEDALVQVLEDSAAGLSDVSSSARNFTSMPSLGTGEPHPTESSAEADLAFQLESSSLKGPKGHAEPDAASANVAAASGKLAVQDEAVAGESVSNGSHSWPVNLAYNSQRSAASLGQSRVRKMQAEVKRVSDMLADLLTQLQQYK